MQVHKFSHTHKRDSRTHTQSHCYVGQWGVLLVSLALCCSLGEEAGWVEWWMASGQARVCVCVLWRRGCVYACWLHKYTLEIIFKSVKKHRMCQRLCMNESVCVRVWMCDLVWPTFPLQPAPNHCQTTSLSVSFSQGETVLAECVREVLTLLIAPCCVFIV